MEKTETKQAINTLIKGIKLTKEQKVKLTFNGMKNERFVENHSFYFDSEGNPAKNMYPICHSVDHLES